jgi:hypothetical protein
MPSWSVAGAAAPKRDDDHATEVTLATRVGGRGA